MVGIVVVSHSRALARAALALATQMVAGETPRVALAAGLDEETFGTNPVSVREAIEEVDSPDGVVVLCDLGSAILSAEMALEFLADDVRERVVISPAPLVEGLVMALVTASGGASASEVATEASNALAGKISQLTTPAEPVEGTPAAPVEGTPVAPVEGTPARQETGGVSDDGAPAASAIVVVNIAHGLHARPAARLDPK